MWNISIQTHSPKLLILNTVYRKRSFCFWVISMNQKWLEHTLGNMPLSLVWARETGFTVSIALQFWFKTFASVCSALLVARAFTFVETSSSGCRECDICWSQRNWVFQVNIVFCQESLKAKIKLIYGVLSFEDSRLLVCQVVCQLVVQELLLLLFFWGVSPAMVYGSN